MKKIYFTILIFFLPILVLGLEYPKINSKMVEIYDINDDKILYEIDANEKASIASLTKIATTITAIENIKDLDEEVTITNEILKTVRWDASIAGLKVGDKVTYRDLLYASILPSGADATNSLAILSSESIENFVKKMNELATRIGLKHTHFINTTGLDDKEHYSTADDIRKLLLYSLKNPLFKEIYTTRNYSLSNGLNVKSTLYAYTRNANIDISKIKGSKTGFTLDAGYCLSSLSEINGHEMIIIVLKATNTNGKYYNIVDSVELINFLLTNYKNEILVNENEIIKNIPVYLSNIDNYEIKASKSITKYLPSDFKKDDFKIEYTGLEELNFKNKIGTKIGTIKYYFENELLLEEDVILNIKIKMNLKKIIKEYYYILITIVIIIILIPVLISKKNKLNKKRTIKYS